MTTSTRTWSEQQTAIFDWFRASTLPNGQTSSDLIVRARAGTGKTTTIIEGVRYAPEAKILLAAFNKRIADELNTRLSDSNPNAIAKTLHAVGFAAVLRNWRVKPEPGSVRADALSVEVCGTRTPDPIIKLVSKLHTKAREMAPHASEYGDLSDIAVEFECIPDQSWDAQGYNGEYVERRALEAMALAAAKKPLDGVIDFADMIFLPLRNGWLQKSFDLVVVDEAQDMTVAQLEIARGVCRGRICVVGDNRQAIYGFRGADSESLDRLKAELNAAELGLTVTYRCGKAIVAHAATMVPDFTAGPGNSEGLIRNTPVDALLSEAENGDFILSRINAPLVKTAMTLLRNGKRARVAGRDIGAGLKALVRKLAKGSAANSIPMFIDRVLAWSDRETARLTPALANKKTETAAQAKLDLIADQAAMLQELAEGALSVYDLTQRIDALFTDDGLGSKGFITLSSVHKAKGLEADRVFILSWTLRGGAKQKSEAAALEEENIRYVAVTRAKHELVWVTRPEVA